MTYALIKTDGSVSLDSAPVEDLTVTKLHELIGCDVYDIVRCDDLLMLVDDCGVLMGRPYNVTASLIAHRLVVGDVILCGEDVDPVTEEHDIGSLPPYMLDVLIVMQIGGDNDV